MSELVWLRAVNASRSCPLLESLDVQADVDDLVRELGSLVEGDA